MRKSEKGTHPQRENGRKKLQTCANALCATGVCRMFRARHDASTSIGTAQWLATTVYMGIKGEIFKTIIALHKGKIIALELTALLLYVLSAESLGTLDVKPLIRLG